MQSDSTTVIALITGNGDGVFRLSDLVRKCQELRQRPWTSSGG